MSKNLPKSIIEDIEHSIKLFQNNRMGRCQKKILGVLVCMRKLTFFHRFMNHPTVEVFLQKYRENLLPRTVYETVKYTHHKNLQNCYISVPMLKRFIGFLLYT